MSMGGESSAPSSQTQAQQGPSPYVQPYIEENLGRAQALTTQPYQQYSGQIVSGASPLQTQAFQQVGNLQRPAQFAMGTELAEAGGRGMLTTPAKALQYGQAGANYGEAAANLGLTGVTAGAQYANMATDPASQQAYMSPYMQNVVDYQKSEAIRDFAKQTPALKAQAVGQGAYGGSRQAIVQSEANRALNSQLQGIEATGRQSAYDRAVQQQQFGANLGLQGLGVGLQGQQLGMQGAGVGLAGVGGAQAGYGGATQAGGTLGQIGSQQGQFDLNRLQLMLQAGQQQRGISQDALTSQYQQYQNNLNYPYQQLAFMQGMYSGLPMTSAASTMYAGAPTSSQMGLGTLGTAASLYGAYKGGYKEGGEVKSYKYGGAIPEQKLAGMADNLSVEQLQERLRDPQLTPGERQVFAEALAEKQQQEARMGGIAAAGGEMFNTMGMAGGGIIAFAEGGSNLIGREFGGVDPDAMAEDQARVDSLQLEKSIKQYEFLKEASPVAAERFLANNPEIRAKVEQKAAPTTSPLAAPPPAAAAPAPQVQKGIVPSAGAPAASKSDEYINTPFGPQMQSPSVKDVYGQRQALLKDAGIEQGGGERFKKLMGLYEQREAGAEAANKQDMFLRMAQSFAKAGSTFKPGGGTQAFLEEAGNFAGGEATAKKAQQAAQLENVKAMAALEEGRRKEAIGDVDAAEKFYQTAEAHMIQRNNALTSANATIKAAQINAAATRASAQRPYERMQLAKELMTADPKLSLEQAVQKASTLMSTTDEAKSMDLKKAAVMEAGKLIAPGGAMYKQFRDLQKQNPEAAQQFYGQLIQNQYNAMAGSGGAPAGGGNLVQNKDGSFNYVPR